MSLYLLQKIDIKFYRRAVLQSQKLSQKLNLVFWLRMYQEFVYTMFMPCNMNYFMNYNVSEIFS